MLKNNCCVGILLIIGLFLIFIFGASYIIDSIDSGVMNNNTTLNIDGINITVPVSNNSSINNSYSLDHVNDMNVSHDMSDNFTENNSCVYHDNVHNITIYVINASRTGYITEPDGEEIETFDGSGSRVFVEKKTINDKIILVEVDEEKQTARRIINNIHTQY